LPTTPAPSSPAAPRLERLAQFSRDISRFTVGLHPIANGQHAAYGVFRVKNKTPAPEAKSMMKRIYPFVLLNRDPDLKAGLFLIAVRAAYFSRNKTALISKHSCGREK
jgi:hypothetical protein